MAEVEQTAIELDLPVVIEGYPPPHDHRLNHVKVTPDPGVIEVNVHPAHSWDELVKNTTGAVRRCPRTAGWGPKSSCSTAGTPAPAAAITSSSADRRPPESPLLRRPDLLRSLVAYWHNHPSLSYLFSGLFIGPTSQAPRVDEARTRQSVRTGDRVRADSAGARPCPPWLVDRIFRHLLVDVTGNTHRAEFCIDKLYLARQSAPAGLGLVEFRAFEMPPHARMSLTQQLLLRALIARFWKTAVSPSRWCAGERSCTIASCCRTSSARISTTCSPTCSARAIRSSDEWFAPHFEFRFPLLRQRRLSRRAARTASGDRAVARAGRRSRAAAARCAMSIRRSSGCR